MKKLEHSWKALVYDGVNVFGFVFFLLIASILSNGTLFSVNQERENSGILVVYHHHII